MICEGCGARFEWSPTCPACDRPVDAGELEGLPDAAERVWGIGSSYSPYGQIRAAVRLCLTASGQLDDQNLRLPPSQTQSPRFPIGIEWFDQYPRQGGYGVTMLGAGPKVGKSLMALRCACMSAAQHWTVVYFNAEMTRSQVAVRFNGIMETLTETQRAGVLERLQMVHVDQTVTLDALALRIDHAVREDTVALLVVLDSLQSITAWIDADFFDALRDVSRYLVRLRRLTEGVVSALVVSELNKAGGLKGGNTLEHWADYVITAKRGPQDSVELAAKYGREGGEGVAGRHYRVPGSARFIPAGSVAPAPATRSSEERDDWSPAPKDPEEPRLL